MNSYEETVYEKATARLFQLPLKKNFFIVLMVKIYRYHEILPSLGCQYLQGSVASPRALVGKVQASS
jgi:hypothetical protein